MKTFEGKLVSQNIKVGIVAARFNEFITSKLLSGAMDGLLRHDVQEADVHVAWVPGAFEIPLVASKMAKSGKYDAVICLGAVIRGSTSHYDYVCNEVSKGIATVSLESGVPVLFGVLTTENIEQAIERASVDSPSVTTGDADLASIEVALNRLLRQMQEAKLQQMRFVNDASHELRTPIAVIQGYVNMLDRWGKDDPDVLAESITSLKAESEHMQELVEQLLFLARGDAGRTVLRRANTNLAALVGEVCEESQMIDAGHTYRLAYDAALTGDPRCNASVDVALVKQALRVIVQNAAKYSDAGTPISFGVAPDAGAGTIDISVEDEGIGMNQESAAHAFERFYRADNARDAGAQGSGLGLAIAKWIVDSHGGVIGVTSVEGVGSRFTIRLPR